MRARSWSKWITYVAAVFLPVLILIGMLYERAGERADRKKYPQIGRSIDVGGRALNLYCSGNGSPTVVLATSGHTAGYRWVNLQSQIAGFTRACWYDRAGYGWSDPAPSPPTFRTDANDLHALLRSGTVNPPYLFVGEGLAGFHIRVYHALYPNEVAGAVLVNSAEVGPPGHEKGYQPGRMAGLPSRVKSLSCQVLGPTLLRVGLLRLFWSGHDTAPIACTALSREQQEELTFLSTTPVSITGGEGCKYDQSLAELQGSGNLGDLPLVVITSVHPVNQMQAEEFAKNHAPGQPQLAALSSAGRQVLTEDSDSMSRAISQAVREIVISTREASHR